MNDIINTIIYSIVTVVILPLITLGGNALIKWISQKTKNEKLNNYLTSASEIVLNSIKATAQTFVNGLKESGKFDADAQKQALELTKATVISQLSKEAQAYITTLCGDFDKWIETQIEAQIATSKA